MKLRCASCGWTDDVVHAGGKGFELARHLRGCSARDEALYVPRWSIYDGVLECAWTTEAVGWKPFTEAGLREIGIERVFAPSDGSRHNG